MHAEDYNMAAAQQEALEMIRQAARDRMQERYTADPALHEAASEIGRHYAYGVCEALGADPAQDPVAPVIEAAVTRLAFAFTDPADHADTLTERLITTEIAEVWHGYARQSGDDVTVQGLATHLDVISANLVLFEAALRLGGELEGLAADGRYQVTKMRLEMVITPDADPAQE